jgi:hypothetical protein
MFMGESSENLRRLRHAAQIDTIPLLPETRANPDYYAFGHSVNRTVVVVHIFAMASTERPDRPDLLEFLRVAP